MKFKLSGKTLLKHHSAIFEEYFDEWCANHTSSIEKLIEVQRLYQKYKINKEDSQPEIPTEIYNALLDCAKVRVYLDRDHSTILQSLGVPEEVEIIGTELNLLNIEWDSAVDLTQPNLGLIPNVGYLDCILDIPIEITEEQIQDELTKGEWFVTLYHNANLDIGGWLLNAKEGWTLSIEQGDGSFRVLSSTCNF